jgi:chromate transporter
MNERELTQPGKSRPAYPSLRDAVAVWARIALLSFGGPAGQIAVMHRILVEEKRWIGENRFLHALNFCMLLPGPEAQQLCIYIGWLLHRTLGGIIAGVFFVLPGLVAIMVLSWIYAIYGNVGFVEALFFGLKAAVLAFVLQAVVRIGGRALRNGAMVGLAAASFVAIFVFDIPFPLIVAAAALIGYLGARSGWSAFKGNGGHGAMGKVHLADAESAELDLRATLGHIEVIVPPDLAHLIEVTGKVRMGEVKVLNEKSTGPATLARQLGEGDDVVLRINASITVGNLEIVEAGR